MKKVKFLISTMILLLAFSFAGNIAVAQQKEKAAKKAAVKKMIDAQDYVFQAQSALPLAGETRFLSSNYDLKITKNSVDSYLPYFGRVYTAPINSSEGGIKFKSADFQYTAAVKKKGGWDIRIKPKDAKDVEQLILYVSENGFATLQVISEQKQTITFSGYVEENKPEEVTAQR